MNVNVPLSILDLARTTLNEVTPADVIARSVRLAQTADRLGYVRVWYPEHHNMNPIASSATALLIQHIAANTHRIRVGAGGIMLPNHPPLIVAEQFGTLETLYPGRIDLGLGRAPGTDPATMWALRRDVHQADRFPENVMELHGYLSDHSCIPGVEAYPGKGTNVPLVILGSSLYGAQFAAQMGLPYSFASHLAPAMLQQAAQVYRSGFNPQGPLAPPNARPYFIAAANVIVSDDQNTADLQHHLAEDLWLQSSLGRQRLLSAEELAVARRTPQGIQALAMLECSFVGTRETVVPRLNAFAQQVQADELILVAMAYNEQQKHRTLELLAPNIQY